MVPNKEGGDKLMKQRGETGHLFISVKYFSLPNEKYQMFWSKQQVLVHFGREKWQNTEKYACGAQFIPVSFEKGMKCKT